MHRSARIAALVVLVAAGLLVTGCDRMWQEEDGLVRITGRLECGDPTVVTLWAGQHTDAGTVTVWNCTSYVLVEYRTTGGWELTETHLAVATSLAGIPQTKKGSPIPGQFPYSATHDPAVTYYRYTIPLDDWQPGTELYIAAHAVVQLVENGEPVREETGWGEGTKFPKSWAMWFKYTVQECYKDVDLPADPVRMRGFYPGANSYWRVELDGIAPGYSVWNGDQWLGWCSEQNVYMTPNVWYSVTLLSSQDPNLPQRCLQGLYGPRHWDRVNWTLNNKDRWSQATITDFQNAFWYLTGELASRPGGIAGTITLDAEAYGNGFRPETGDYIAVITLTPANVQLCWIEIDP